MLWAKMRSLFRVLISRAQVEEETRDEWRFHIETRADDLARLEGLSRTEAVRRARLEFGGHEKYREEARQSRGLRYFDEFKADLKFAVRMFSKSPGFALIAVLTLALGIGANTAIFSVVNSIILRPLPYENADQLVRIVEVIPGTERRDGRVSRRSSLPPEEAQELRIRAQTLSDVVLYSMAAPMTLTGPEQLFTVQVDQVSPSTFQMLGTRPALGRHFGEADAAPGASDVVILSNAAWQEYWAADPAILNQTILLGGRGHLVVGIMPPGFTFPNAGSRFWKPLVLNSQPGRIQMLGAIASLAEGVSQETAAAEVGTILGPWRGIVPAEEGEAASEARRFDVVSVQDERAAPIRSAVLILFCAVGLVLLIACTNVANLLLARTSARSGEIGIRVSMGAGRLRLIRQVLTESVLLAISGGAVGMLLALGGMHLLTLLWPGNLARGGNLPALEGIQVDAAVFAYASAISILTGLLFGLVPAFHVFASRHRIATRSHQIAGPTVGPLGWSSVRNVLSVAQIAMAMTLLVGSGLLINSFWRLATVDAGFDPSDTLTFQVTAPADPSRQSLNEDLLRRLQSFPTVQAAGYSMWPFLGGTGQLGTIAPPGIPQEEIDAGPRGNTRVFSVSSDYLRATGLSLIEGRWLTETDSPGRPAVILINEEFARRYYPDESPIGQFVVSISPDQAPWEIVGVVRNSRQSGLDREAGRQVFVEFRQAVSGWKLSALQELLLSTSYFAVRTAPNSASMDSMAAIVQDILVELDSGAALSEVNTMAEIVSDSIATPRFYAVLLGIFACVAVTLSAIGVYGVIAYLVTQRTREIGIRVALGASRRQVLSLVLGQGLALALVGILLGIGGAVAVTRYLSTMLFGLTPLDATTFVAAAVLFASMTGLASYLPARQATRLDPLSALRHE